MTVSAIFGSIVALTVVAILYTLWRVRRRARAVARAAEELGLTYGNDGSEFLKDGLTDLPLFTLAAFGQRDTISNVITGRLDGSSLAACDYAYWTGSVNTQRFDYAQTVVCFRLAPNRYPAFTLHPAGNAAERASMKAASVMSSPLTAIAKPLAARDERWNAVEAMLQGEREGGIVLPDSPQLSQRYRLMGSDREAIARMFGSPTLEPLLEYESHPLSVESSGHWLAVYHKNRLVGPQKLGDFLKHCVRLQKTLCT